MSTAIPRATFLRLGAAALGATAGGALLAGGARAALPAAPSGNDIGFVQLAATAELVCLAFYERALAEGRNHLSGAERRRLALLRHGDAEHRRRLGYLLQDETPRKDDFEIVFAGGTFGSRRRILAAGERLEGLVAGAYASGCAFTADPGTRLLLARLLAADAEHLGQLRVLSGRPAAAGGLPEAIDFDLASARLDAYLRPTVPTA